MAMEPRPDSPAFRSSATRASLRSWRPALLVLLGLAALQASCFRTSSVTMHGHMASSSRTSRGPVTVNCESRGVADGRGMLFESHVAAKDGFEHRAAFLMLTASEFWFSIDAESEVTQDPEREARREIAMGHADFSWGGAMVHPSGVAVVSATPTATTTTATTTTATTTSVSAPAYTPNRVSVSVPIDTSQLSAPADSPFLAFHGEQVPAPDGSLFLVILNPEGPTRPTRIASDLDLSEIAADPEGFVQGILDEQPLLRELMQEGQ